MRRPASAFCRVGVYEGAPSTVPETGRGPEGVARPEEELRAGESAGLGPAVACCLAGRTWGVIPSELLLSASISHFESIGAPFPGPKTSRGCMQLAVVGHAHRRFLFCLMCKAEDTKTKLCLRRLPHRRKTKENNHNCS